MPATIRKLALGEGRSRGGAESRAEWGIGGVAEWRVAPGIHRQGVYRSFGSLVFFLFFSIPYLLPLLLFPTPTPHLSAPCLISLYIFGLLIPFVLQSLRPNLRLLLSSLCFTDNDMHDIQTLSSLTDWSWQLTGPCSRWNSFSAALLMSSGSRGRVTSRVAQNTPFT